MEGGGMEGKGGSGWSHRVLPVVTTLFITHLPGPQEAQDLPHLPTYEGALFPPPTNWPLIPWPEDIVQQQPGNLTHDYFKQEGLEAVSQSVRQGMRVRWGPTPSYWYPLGSPQPLTGIH